MLKRVNRLAAELATFGIGLFLAALIGGTPAEAQVGGSRKGGAGGKSEGSPPVLFSADEVTYDDQLGLVIARGNVEITQSGRTLLADTVSYNERTDTVTASGHVSMLRENGDTVFANYVELTDSMREGFIKDVRMLMADRSRVAANTGRRTAGNRVEFRKGVYSPCDLCKDDPTAAPLWQIKAARIIHDRDQKLVEYNDATLEIAGVPVLYTPYLSHPDPTVKRMSGFLAPTLGTNSLLGFNATIPYFWAISPDKDATFAPMITSNQGIVYGGEYRERFANGKFELRGSITESNLGTGAPNSTSPPPDQIRGHLFGEGEFDINENIRTGFNLQRTTDPTYLRLYKFGGNETFLRSRAYLEDFEGRNYGVVNAWDFQSLRVGVSDRIQPIILPVGEYTWAGRPMDWGGRFTSTLNALDLVRETGPNSRRLSAGEQFDLPFSGPWGQQFNFVAGMRGDAYYVTSQPLTANGPPTDGTTGRTFPQVGLEWRYPWVRRATHSNTLIEPVAAVYAAPVGLNPPKIPNDDSEAVDFSDADLFVRDRFAGYDQVDSGQRVDYGLKGAWYSDTGPAASFLVGQSYRFQKTSPFAINGQGDGLQRQESDYVGRIRFTPGNYLDFFYRFRFDQRDLRPQRQEVGTQFGPQAVRFSVSYLQLGNNVRDQETPRQQITGSVSLTLNRYWTIALQGTRDLAGDSNFIYSGIGAQYNDECMTFSASLTQDGTVIGNVRPGTTLVFQVVFKNLGEIQLPTIQTTPGSS